MGENGRDPGRTLSRRAVLRLLAGATLAWGSGKGFAASGAILRRQIPSTGEALPVVGMGTSRTFDVGTGEAQRRPLAEVLNRFTRMGGALVDTSPMYGSAETVLGDLASGLGIQPRLFYATKVWTTGREEGIHQMETSMRRLRVDKIDLMQVHNLVDWRTQLKTLRDWQARGRIRYLGITHYVTSAFDDLERVIKAEPLDFVQLNYSIATRDAEDRLLPLAAQREVAVLVNRPFERGALFRKVRGRPLPDWAAELDCQSWAQFFLKYVLSHPGVTCVIPATSKPEHLADNMRAGHGRLPDATQRRRMVDYFAGL